MKFRQGLAFFGTQESLVTFMMVALSSAAIFAIALVQIQTEREGALENETIKNSNLAQAHAERAARVLQLLDQTLLTLRDEHARHGAPSKLNEWLATLRVDRDSVGTVALIGAQGRVIAMTAANNPIDYSDREYFKAHAADSTDRLLIGKPVRGRLTDDWIITLTRRVSRPDGAFGGVVFMAVNPITFARDYAGATLGPNASLALIGLDGITRVRRNSGKISIGEDVRSSRLFKEIPIAPAGNYVGIAASDGVRRTSSYRVLEGYPLAVVVASSLDDVSASIVGRERTYLASVISFLVMVMAFMHAMNRAKHRKEEVIQAAFDAQLRQSKQLLDSVIDNIPVMVFLKRESDLCFELFNRAGENLLGYSRSQLLGKGDYDFWPKEQADAFTAADRKVLASSAVMEIPEEVIKNASGETLYLHTWKVALRDEGGKPTYLLGISLDITERKQADAETAQLAAIVEASGDAIISRTLDGAILSWNPGAEKIFGYSSAEMIGKSVNLTVPLNYQSNLLLINDALLRGELVRREAQRITSDGRLIDVFGSHSPIRDSSGNIVAVSIIFQDITVRKRAEAERASLEVQLSESQKMQAIGTLAGGIAHDFNNILAAILGNTELMRQDLTENPEALESLEEITKASRRGRDLVQQILAFSRRQPADRKPMALAPIVEESARLLRSTLPASVSLQTQCGPDMPAVLANATQIQQVIINLATNAMQAMSGRHGRIDISLDTVVLDEPLAEANPALRVMLKDHPEEAVRLVVKDTGPGMDADTLSRIFEPFFTTKAVNEGTGLGLSVVHGIVQSHQGVITVQSEVGKGTAFTIYLPLAPAESAAKIPDAPDAQLGAVAELNLEGGQHVLYLDDDPFLVSLVKRLLERRGLRVSAYLDPGEALAALRANPASFDLVVSDYNMPGMSGLEVAREVRAIRADLPVVVASGFVDEALQTQAKAAGVREVILKAEAMDGFCEVIARVLNEAANKSKFS